MHLAIHLKKVSDLTPRDIDAWAELESRALDPNAYLSPYFVLPAQRYLADHDAIIIWVDCDGINSRDLVGLGVFNSVGATRHFPLPHLRSFLSRHSYLSGLLVDSVVASEVIEALIVHCAANAFPWHGFEFTRWQADSKTERLLRDQGKQHGLAWYEHERMERAILIPAQAGAAYIDTHFSASRRKELRRTMRRLEDIGPVTWRLLRGEAVDDGCTDRFLELEQAGWKGNRGDALKSNPQDEQFFREMARGFAGAGRAFFTELCVGTQVIASTSNFVSGHAGFAFKIGWHPDYAKMSPGILNEVEMVRHGPELLGELTYVDSGASQGSYIDALWTGRQSVSRCVLATSRAGRFATGAVELGKQVKRHVKTLLAGHGFRDPVPTVR